MWVVVFLEEFHFSGNSPTWKFEFRKRNPARNRFGNALHRKILMVLLWEQNDVKKRQRSSLDLSGKNPIVNICNIGTWAQNYHTGDATWLN